MSGVVPSGDERERIRERLSAFIVSNFLFGDEAGAPADDQSLLVSGIVDSTGILELIEFLENEFSITVAESETTPANLDSVERLAAFVAKKSAVAA